ncbi:MAG: phytanoyl-CoA dioxygenase family protein [Armatimonadetes bacterium]|nr:phytanoyl-CoA dioxygenase family protein [Armatimonadota bacterium]
MALTEEQVRQFYDDGYVAVRNVVSEADLPRYRAAYERMVEKVKANPSKEYGTRIMNGETWGCNSLLHPDLYEPEFTDYLENETLLSALASILGEDLRVEGLKAIWSDEHMEYDLIWHRDGPDEVYTPDGSQKHIQFNTALYPDKSFRLIPGSHRRPLTEEEQAQSRTGRGPLPGEIVAELEPGDVLFMHSHAFHRGKTEPGVFRRTLHTILARTDKPSNADDLVKYRRWYDALGLDDKLSPTVKRLFDNYFSWEGRVTPKEEAPAAY